MKQPNISPPKYALRLLRWFCHEHYLEEIEGDLEELYFERCEERNTRNANFHFWWEVIRSCRPYFWKKTNPTHYLIIQQAMFKNYFKTTYRNLWRNKAFSAINILGLSLSMSICLLIMMVVKGQFDYDNYLDDADRIYRVTTHSTGKNNYNLATTAIPMAALIQNEITGVDRVGLMYRWFEGNALANNKEIPVEGKFVDQDLFEILQWKLKEGNPKTALSKSNGIVLTYETAQKFFGDESALGKPIQINKLFQEPKEGLHVDYFTVTGVLADSEDLSHISFEALLSFELFEEFVSKNRVWMDRLDDWEDTYQNYVYLTLAEESNADAIETQINQAARKHIASDNAGSAIAFKLQNVKEITPYSGDTYSNHAGHAFPMSALILLIGISALILLSAIFNYTNLSTARSITRAREIGVRKVNGATRGQIRVQFTLEAIILSCISLIFALFFLQFLSPAFQHLAQSNNTIYQVKIDLIRTPYTYLWFVGFAIIMGILAGVVPSFYIARLNTIKALKKIENLQLAGKVTLRKILIIIQFSLSIIFIITTLLFYQQSEYLLNLDLGINGENIMEVELKENNYQLIKEQFSKHPEVLSVAGVSHIPGGGSIFRSEVYTKDYQDSLFLYFLCSTPNFLEQVEIEMVTGEFHQKTVMNKKAMSTVVINEAAVQKLKFASAEEAIGQIILSPADRPEEKEIPLEIIGVTQNFMNSSVQGPVRAMAIYNNEAFFNYASLKINSSNYSETIQKLEASWKEIDSIKPFTYRFFDKQIGEEFKRYAMLIKIIGFAGFLAIIIATIGFLGIVIFNTNNRIKEIAIRKVHGAQLKGLFFLLSRGFMSLIAISSVISIPIAYLVNTTWLQEYPKRIDINFIVFVIAIGATLCIGLLTIAPQLWRVAVTNPAKTLKDE